MATLLSVFALRDHVETDLSDDALQRIIDSEDGEITARYGAATSETDLLAGGDRLLFLPRPESTITSVTEDVDSAVGDPTITVLATDDYRVWGNGRYLERLATGTNPRVGWGDRVTVVSTPTNRNAQRILVLIQLCKLAIAYSGVKQQAVGGNDYIETSQDYTVEREKLLRTLRPTGAWFA